MDHSFSPILRPLVQRVGQSVKVHGHMVDFVSRVAAVEVQYAAALRTILQSTIDILDTGVEIPSAFACVAESVDAVSTLHNTYAEQLNVRSFIIDASLLVVVMLSVVLRFDPFTHLTRVTGARAAVLDQL